LGLEYLNFALLIKKNYFSLFRVQEIREKKIDTFLYSNMYTGSRGNGKSIVFPQYMDQTDFEDLLRIQNKMASLVAREAEVDSKIKILTLMDEITGNKRKKIQVEHIIIEGKHQGMSEREITSTLEGLKDDGILAEPETGYVIKT
jgi:hypothetical protein